MVSSLVNRRRLRSLHLQFPKVRGKAGELKVRRKVVANSNKTRKRKTVVLPQARITTLI